MRAHLRERREQFSASRRCDQCSKRMLLKRKKCPFCISVVCGNCIPTHLAERHPNQQLNDVSDSDASDTEDTMLSPSQRQAMRKKHESDSIGGPLDDMISSTVDEEEDDGEEDEEGEEIEEQSDHPLRKLPSMEEANKEYMQLIQLQATIRAWVREESEVNRLRQEEKRLQEPILTIYVPFSGNKKGGKKKCWRVGRNELFYMVTFAAGTILVWVSLGVALRILRASTIKTLSFVL